MSTKVWIIDLEDTGLSLKAFLKKKNPHLTVKQIDWALDQNLCQVNGHPERMKKSLLGKGDKVCLDEQGIVAKSLVFDKKDILYEDSYLILYNKPTGFLCEPKFINKFFKERWLLCHRLDRHTSGILILAKDEKTLDAMADLFKRRKVKKIYITIVDKEVKRLNGTISDDMVRGLDSKGEAVWDTVDQGLSARTTWERLRKGRDCSLLSCSPETGRTHQIRVHMKSMGHPLIGDYRYTSTFQCQYPCSNFYLHAHKIAFQHPITGKEMETVAPLSVYFQDALNEIF